MKAYQKALVTLAIGAAVAGGVKWTMAEGAQENQASETLRAAPSAVQAAVVKVAGTNKIGDFDKKQIDGKTVYELEYKIGGANYGADIDANGTILDREVEVDLSFVPAGVIAAADKAHSDGKVGEASVISDGSKLYFELDVKVAKDTREMAIGADGSIIKDSIEPPEADEAPDAGKKAADKEDKD